MNTQTHPGIRLPAARRQGFALVVTLSLLILLTVIAIGLLSLSGITLRAASHGNAQAVADSNARLALMLAIGDLQKSLGPDQRISATADSFGTGITRPNVVGVWDSLGWQAPAGAAPSPAEKAAQFRRWLVSTTERPLAADFALASAAEPADSIWLSNPQTTGSLSAADPGLRAERIPVSAGRFQGGLAWIVSDESTKVPLNIEPDDRSQQIAGNIANRTAASAPRPGVLDDSLDDIADPTRLISLQTAVLSVGQSNREQITARSHALTTSSLGLLTDPVNGGLKTDLTPLLEAPGNNVPAGAFANASPYFTPDDGAPSWDFLRNHYQLHKRVTNQAAAAPKFTNRAVPDMVPARATAANPDAGVVADPERARLLPVIAKLQIVFSLVSHHAHLSDRIQAFNTRAQPQGNNQHAVPHLVYDPVVTLYNPYDVELELTHLRIRISDPPVGFQFRKHDRQLGIDSWYRQEFAQGEYHGLARFQIDNERNRNARKVFTLVLTDRRTNNSPGNPLTLLPGEVKVFSPWVEPSWTWGMETGGGYTPRSFFDWNVNDDLGNKDRRPVPHANLGVAAIPGLDFRAGLQTDHLSYGSGRPADTRYSWETSSPFGLGFLSLKISDDVTVNARPQRVVSDPNLPDFTVDILAGRFPNAQQDILRTFEFRLEDVESELSTDSNSSNVISRRFNNANLLQTATDPSPGGKSPFAIFTMTAKTTKDRSDDSKSWLFNNMVTEGGKHDSTRIGNAAQSYDLKLQEIQDFTTFPGVEYDDATRRGFFGAIATASGGVSVVPRYRVPITPAASLGDWIGANLIASGRLPRVSYPLGNSFAHPLIPSDRISTPSPMPQAGSMLDHTYLMNAALWDSYFFSSATDYNSPAFAASRSKRQVLSDFFTGTEPMLNSRLTPYIAGTGDAETLAEEYAGLGEIDFSRSFARNAAIEGAFNVNSTAVDAWRAVLSSLRDVAVKGYAAQTFPVEEKTAFVRNGLPVVGATDEANPANTVDVLGQVRWAGFRTLTDSQIENLASLIVGEIRVRAAEDKAPNLSLADFVNRRIGAPADVHALRGIIQTAIDKSGINDEFLQIDSNDITGSSLPPERIRGLATPEALDGFTADGAAPFLTQGDLLTALAPILTVRGDTFTIRAYGEARTADGQTVTARSWCEATVQRVPEFIDPTDPPEAEAGTLSTANQLFGRRFIITSFRWLNGSEI